MMCKLLVYTSFLLALLACGRTNSTIREYAVDVNECPSADSLFIKTTCVTLESTENCIIGEITCVKCTERYIAVQSGDGIHVFDREGKHISTIARKGHGEGEYVSISDYAICVDTLLVLSRAEERLYLYHTRTGNFLRKVSLDAGYCHILSLDSENMLLSSENSNATKYNLVEFDIVRDDYGKRALPFHKEEGLTFSQFCPFGQMTNGSPAYCLPFNYHVYATKNGEWTPIYQFTFNTSRQLPPNKEEKTFIELSDACCNQDVVQYIEHFRETKDFLYLDYSIFGEYGLTHCLSRISRKSGECVTARLSNRRYPDLPYCFTAPVGYEGDKLITAHTAFPLLQYEKENGLYFFTKQGLKAEHNPVLFFTIIR